MSSRMLRHPWIFTLGLVLAAASAHAQSPVEYRLTFPNYVQHVMDVEVTFPDLPQSPVEIHMSRSSPGRYALHEFAKNVFDERFTDATGRTLTATRPDLHSWVVADHRGQVRMRYRVFGNRVDGTYFSVGATMAHLNMPATLTWARGLEARGARVTLTQPPGLAWTVATQLFTTSDPLVFTAPNLQYLMDSPIQFGAQVLRTFGVPKSGGARSSNGTSPAAASAQIRLALRHEGSDADADAYAADLERIVREQEAIFGELPAFDTGAYTFLAAYMPGASGDGMEHRNSTVVTSSGSIAENRIGLLGTASHEFFHCWNVERIRPKTLEPFNFADANVSGELWLAEGFTSYYGPLTLLRTGLTSLEVAARQWAGSVNAVTLAPGRRFRSAVDMSRLAPFVDAASAIDPTNWDNTFLSYYTYGAALGLGLDLSLRDLTNNRVSADDFMRALWTKYGKTPGTPGLVATPYTLADARTTLAEVSGDKAFADTFFAKYVEGHDVVDYGRLLARAGLVLRPRRASHPWMGEVRFEAADGEVRVSAPSRMGTPAWDAGLGEGDVVLSFAGAKPAAAADIEKAIEARKPGETVDVVVRRGPSQAPRELTLRITLAADPQQDVVTIESTGAAITPAQQQFRNAWVKSRVK
jgi:predicted metalloprotease with PDZ domain